MLTRPAVTSSTLAPRGVVGGRTLRTRDSGGLTTIEPTVAGNATYALPDGLGSARLRTDETGAIGSLTFSATATGAVSILGAVVVPTVMAFLLLAVIFFTLLVVYDLLIPCEEATRHVTWDGTFEGLGLGTIGGAITIGAAGIATETAVPRRIREFIESLPPDPDLEQDPVPTGPFWPLITGSIAVAIAQVIVESQRGGPAEQPSPEATASATSTATPTPTVTPTPTPNPDRCTRLNNGEPPNFMLDNPYAGLLHIMLDHGWRTAADNRGRFYEPYSTASQITLIYQSAIAQRAVPWIWTRSKCRTWVDLAATWGLVGETRKVANLPRQPTSVVELRATDFNSALPTLESMYPALWGQP